MSEPRNDINQLLMQVKFTFQVSWRLVDYAEDSNVHIPYSSFQTAMSMFIVSTIVAAAWKSHVFFWRPLILKYSVWCKRDMAAHSR